MDPAVYGTVFWISAPEELGTSALSCSRGFEGISQLVRKTVNRVCVTSPSDSSDNHTRMDSDGYNSISFPSV
jgi:hypothetical protein